VPLVEDLGSGSLLPEFAWEPTVQASIAAGVDLLCFSGDKMLGGPQCGIIVGRQPLVQQLQKHPLMRALRVDKLTLAALEGTLLEYHAGRAKDTIPVARMLAMTAERIEARAQAIAEALHAAGWRVALASGVSAVGGGSAPGIDLATVLIALEHGTLSSDRLEERLRATTPPIIARIDHDRVVLDLRTVPPEHDQLLISTLATLVAP
jgi:L-seryl-tRNA(Ser) seleniumtransferase